LIDQPRLLCARAHEMAWRGVVVQAAAGYARQMEALRPAAEGQQGETVEDPKDSAAQRNLSLDMERLQERLEETVSGLESIKATLAKQLQGVKQTEQVVKEKSFADSASTSAAGPAAAAAAAASGVAAATAAVAGSGGGGPMRERVAAACHRHAPY
jgi:hypothetical protein